MKKQIKPTSRQKEMLSIIYKYINNSGYPPSIEEMRENLKVSSNQSVLDLLYHLEKKQMIKRVEGIARSITILPLGYEILDKSRLAPFLGASHAGAPVNMLDIQGEWIPLPGKDVAKLNREVFVLKVNGDSMINSGIDDGDMVLVQSQKEFSSGDLVLADLNGDSTIKRFISDDNPPYIYLKPENPKYEIIPFTHEMRLVGKIVSIIKNNELKGVN
ncbi:MAG: transcriptional repressor LexA [Candidatus Beckwithbacteria bacterium]